MTFNAGLNTARDISRDSSGEINFNSVGSGTVTATSSGVVSTSVQVKDKVNFERVKAGIAGFNAAGDISIYRDGISIAQKLSTTSLTTTASPNAIRPTFNVKANITNLNTSPTTLNFSKSGTSEITITTGFGTNESATETFNTVVSGSGNKLKMGIYFNYGNFNSNPVTASVKVNGNTFGGGYYTTSTAASTTKTFTTTGTFYSPTVTWYGHHPGEGYNMAPKTANNSVQYLKKQSGATVNITVSKDTTTKV